jgi:two-component system chemotaxis response regulator CheB
MPAPIRVLIVDDSSFMRRSIERMLTTEDIQVVGSARDGLDALEKIPLLKPDIVTMDVEMPRMDGLTCLKRIMAECPLPVLMFSSLTHEGAKATLDALALGALDFVAKEKDYTAGDENILKIQDKLREKVRGLVGTTKFSPRHLPPAARAEKAPAPPPTQAAKRASVPSATAFPAHPRAEMIVLGCSTGGPKALQEFLPYLPKELPVPMLIVQHMPASFTRPFAERLNGISKVEIKEAANGDVPQAGRVYIAPGGIHMHIKGRSGRYSIELNPEPAGTLHRPSVDVLFQSAFDACDCQLISVILTGMGADGALGMQKLKQKGAYTMAEAESSCIVYGMPKSAVELGCVDIVVPVQDMAGIIKQHFQL